MKKALLIASVLLIAVISTACINNIAVQELNNKAAEYMEKGDYESAVNRLQASIDLDSTMYETYYNLGIAATKAKKYDVAIEAFKNGLKIKPDFTDFHYSLATAQIEYSDSLAEPKDDEKKEVDFETKKLIVTLKHDALINLKTYQKETSNIEDKEDLEEIISDLEKYINEQQVFPEKIEG